jgi:hypothetical protein
LLVFDFLGSGELVVQVSGCAQALGFLAAAAISATTGGKGGFEVHGICTDS